jgi:hypothetical protein
MNDELVNGGVLRRKKCDHDCLLPNIEAHKLDEGDEFICSTCGSVWCVQYGCSSRLGDRELAWDCLTRVKWRPASGRRASATCGECKGVGTVRREDEYGDMHNYQCSRCKGDGKVLGAG